MLFCIDVDARTSIGSDTGIGRWAIVFPPPTRPRMPPYAEAARTHFSCELEDETKIYTGQLDAFYSVGV